MKSFYINSGLVPVTLLSASLLGGCTSLSGPPPRTPWAGADRVESANPADIVGNWQVRDLNPIEGEDTGEATIRYLQDGTVTSKLQRVAGTEALGDMSFELTGNWQLDGDVVSHSNMVMRETAGNQFGALMTSLVNRQGERVAGVANIHELSADRMVWVGVDDGRAVEYTRIPDKP